MRQNTMRISNCIITFLLLMTFHLNAMSNDTCDFGTISQDTTLMWDGELPMYTPAVKTLFKTTKRMYLTMELNGNIDCVQNMSQSLNFCINSYRVEYLLLPKGNYMSTGVVTYNILNKIPYVHAKLTFRESKPESKPEESVDYSTLPNAYPYTASNHIFMTEPTVAVKETSESTISSIITKLFYDGFGRLVETVNVAASPNRKHVTTIQGYDYYDTRRRCTEKKLPGCDWVRYVYDRADNAVFTQNGGQRKQGKWMFLYGTMGMVGNPATDNNVSVFMNNYDELIYIHTHPSGENNSFYWIQAPSLKDIENTNNNNSYVFGMRDKRVFIYNKTGIISYFPLFIYTK